jgi:protein involved in polysaccharide export with SLBB domain
MINVRRLAGRWGVLCLLVAVGWLAAGCKTGSAGSGYGGTPDPSGKQFASVSPVAGTNDSIDLFHVGDSVTIEYSDMPVTYTSRDEKIKEDGTITLLEGKTFTAAGKRRAQLEREVHDYYVPNYYLKMTVSIRQQKETQFYYVRGEVKSPGRQVYISRITVTRAIGSAGDFTDFARKTTVRLIRADGSTKILNAKKLIKNPALDPEVLPGDTVYVERRGPLY